MRVLFSLLGLMFLISCSGVEKIQDEKQRVNAHWVVVNMGENELSAGTQMMCPEMEIPDLFNRTLGSVRSWELKKNQLHLFDEQGEELMQLKKID
jgi:hypothetical protein